MWWLRILRCRLFGHPEPEVGVYPDNGLVVWCPRCRLIFAGAENARRWGGTRRTEKDGNPCNGQ